MHGRHLYVAWTYIRLGSSPPYQLPWNADGYAGPCLYLGSSLKLQRELSYLAKQVPKHARTEHNETQTVVG